MSGAGARRSDPGAGAAGGRNGRRRRNGSGPLRRWHRRLGVAASALILLFVLSGLPLNHAADWGLGDRRLTGPAARPFLDRAGEVLLLEPLGGGPLLVWTNGHLVLSGADAVIASDRPVGAAVEGEAIVVAAGEGLLLLDRKGRVVEHLLPPLVPEGIAAVGRDARGRILLDTQGGAFVWDPTSGTGRPAGALSDGVRWSVPHKQPQDADEQAAAEAARLRVGVALVDALAALHSGRAFGLTGRLAADLAGLALAYLALSGLVLAKRRNGRSRGRRSPRP